MKKNPQTGAAKLAVKPSATLRRRVPAPEADGFSVLLYIQGIAWWIETDKGIRTEAKAVAIAKRRSRQNAGCGWRVVERKTVAHGVEPLVMPNGAQM